MAAGRFPTGKNIAANTITGSYVVQIAASTSSPYGHVAIWYTGDTDIWVSFDGSADHVPLPGGGGTYVLDAAACGVLLDGGLYVKHNGAAPTTGRFLCAAVRGESA